MSRLLVSVLFGLLAACSNESSQKTSTSQSQVQSAELRFGASEIHPALRIRIQWNGIVSDAQLIPAVNQTLYQIATECVRITSIVEPASYIFEVEFPSLKVKSTEKDKPKTKQCIGTKLAQIAMPKGVAPPKRLTVAFWATP